MWLSFNRSTSCPSPSLVKNKEIMRSPSTSVSVSRREPRARRSGGPAEILLAATHAPVAQSNQPPEPTRGTGAVLFFQSCWPRVAQLERSTSCPSPPLVYKNRMMQNHSTEVSVFKCGGAARQSGGPAEVPLAAADTSVAQSNQPPEPTRGTGAVLFFLSRWHVWLSIKR